MVIYNFLFHQLQKEVLLFNNPTQQAKNLGIIFFSWNVLVTQ